MQKLLFKELLGEITAIKAETKMHLHFIGDYKGRLKQRLDRRLKNLDKLKQSILSIKLKDELEQEARRPKLMKQS